VLKWALVVELVESCIDILLRRERKCFFFQENKEIKKNKHQACTVNMNLNCKRAMLSQ
jgi:hypothetical protein